MRTGREIYEYFIDKGYITGFNIEITDRDPEFVQTFDVQKGCVGDVVVVTVPEGNIWMLSTNSQYQIGLGNTGGLYIEFDAMAYDPKIQMYRKVNSKYLGVALKGGQQLRFRAMCPLFDIKKSSISYSCQWDIFVHEDEKREYTWWKYNKFIPLENRDAEAHHG